jgi:AcrR family transcriptional regulator
VRTRARILDATAAVLARRGFSGTRLSDIAEEARVQAPAIYYYYSSREDLIEDVVAAGAAAMLKHLTATLSDLPHDTSPTDRLAAAVAAHLRQQLGLSDYARALARNGNQLPEQLGRRALQTVAAYSDVWRGLVEDLGNAGLLQPGLDPSIGRMLTLGALNWSVEWWDPERGSLEELTAVAQSLVLHALLQEPSWNRSAGNARVERSDAMLGGAVDPEPA